MNAHSAICVEDWAIEAQNGDRQECKRGKEYTIFLHDDEKTVTVFSQFWVPAPRSIFAGIQPLNARKT